MRILRLLALGLLSALALSAQSDCNYEWWVLTQETPFPYCGYAPFPVQIAFSYYFEVDNLDGDYLNSTNVTVTGNGYCSGLGNNNYCSQGGAPLPYVNWNTTYYAGSGVWTNVATIAGELPGGTLKALGYGCAGTTYTTSAPVNLSAPHCPKCPSGCDPAGDGACSCCPIVLDTSGRGFRLTDVEHGVYFRWKSGGPKFAMSWTDPAGGNGWLVLPSEDGQVHDATNMFSAISPQPKTPNPNGYIALAVYDLPSEGGNGDGWIDARDKIYSRLRIWIDANQDGEAQPNELHTLDELGVKRIGLRYRLAEKTDQYGNVFRYLSQVLDESDPKAYDVWVRLDPEKKVK
jgi:hypothetical protein